MYKLCMSVNRLFKLPVHPFNLHNEGKKTYAQWQYEKGFETIKFYLKHSTTDEMFKDKAVLDIGCGAGGKTVYYASLGVKRITGLEILEKYREEAENLAKENNLADKFAFVRGDAADMPFDDETFDTIIMNDAMEHVAEPEKVIEECYRVLKKGGRLYLNFPPYNHPYGAHLSDAIGIPWVHVFFSEKTLIKAYKELVKDLPDGQERIKFRISRKEDGTEYFSYINKMSIKRANKILQKSSFELEYYKEEPLRSFFRYPARLPFLKEFLVKMVVCVLKK
ncbi:MAG TPA: class I SAM-dependent methyltransferase [Sedimentibacter sp.]|nr:class I SAM-dependent methyltransferase [Sedimentibacter sp.]HHZ00395.1 class I SAM-dependent methyltransferase [Tissierellia bacterium]HOK49429.1 class I SAM-dependent methyltransferase [Sedimentibacter sp.]HOW22485.1 class I SAM-dependent methyltransferase [Sedimentibacter sp.]